MQEKQSETLPPPAEAPEATTPAAPPFEPGKSLVRFPHQALFSKAFSVDEVNEYVVAIAKDLVEVMKREDGMGLAAPQVGMNLRIVAVSPGPGAEPTVLCDPVILKRRGQEWGIEACLSLPGIQGEVMRSSVISVRALGLDNQVVEFEARDMYARVIQHEIDHLDGMLLYERLGPADRLRARPKLEQLAVAWMREHGPEELRDKPLEPRRVLNAVIEFMKKSAVGR